MSDSQLPTLPGDDVRQIMWRYPDRFDLQMAVQSARGVARSTAARLVADGLRNTHEWSDEKGKLLTAFDQSGLTALYMDLDQGGFIEGPKVMAMSLVAFELSWVDAGAATGSLANNLALAPIQAKGTDEQRKFYMGKSLPPQPGEDRAPWRGAFALTEPLPFVGVDTGILSGKARIVDWPEGGEPLLQIDKRGRFITNMDFANFVTAAVDSDDPRIKGSFMVILEETDPGTYDRGSPTLKLVHQLSSTRDPVFSLQVPASRIVGGYKVVDGVIVPKHNHSEVIASVFHRTRIPVGLMTAAKLLSAIEPVIRYQRSRFHGGESGEGSPRHDLGLQMNEDVTLRLIDVWATGEAAASVGFEAARQADDFDPIERAKDELFEQQGLTGRRQFMALRKKEPEVIEYLDLLYRDEASRDAARFEELGRDTLVQFALRDARANLMNPAVKLWNTGYGATMMREAVSLMGGYGTTEDCPGFLPQKWMDAQLEATYEGPEAVQRRHLTVGMTSRIFRHEFNLWIQRLEKLADSQPAFAPATLAHAMKLWAWTIDFLESHGDPSGKKLYHGKRQGVTFPLADAVCWLLSARSLLEDTIELKTKGADNPVLADSIDGFASFYADLCHVHIARAAGEVSRICANLVFGFQDSPDEEEAAEFAARRDAIDRSLCGSELAKARAARSLTSLMIPEALDYPV